MVFILTLLFGISYAQRTYCNPPDPLFNDGVKNSSWGDADPTDWNYQNTADWKSNKIL